MAVLKIWDGTQWVLMGRASTSGLNTLAGLEDVAIGTVTSGQVLSYNGSNWINATSVAVAGGGGGGSLPGVDIDCGDFTGADDCTIDAGSFV